MSISTSVRFPEALRGRLKQAAKARGTTVNRLIVETMDREFPEPVPDSQRADLALAHLVGCFASEGHPDARNVEHELREIMRRKERDGRL